MYAKHRPWLLGFLLCCLVTSCAPQPPRKIITTFYWPAIIVNDPRPAEQVELFLTRQPTRAYHPLGIIQESSAYYSFAALTDRLRQDAAQVGADAIINLERTTDTQGQYVVLADARYPHFIMRGTAIQWRPK